MNVGRETGSGRKHVKESTWISYWRSREQERINWQLFFNFRELIWNYQGIPKGADIWRDESDRVVGDRGLES